MQVHKGIQALTGRPDTELRELFSSDPRNKKVTLGSASRTRRGTFTHDTTLADA